MFSIYLCYIFAFYIFSWWLNSSLRPFIYHSIYTFIYLLSFYFPGNKIFSLGHIFFFLSLPLSIDLSVYLFVFFFSLVIKVIYFPFCLYLYPSLDLSVYLYTFLVGDQILSLSHIFLFLSLPLSVYWSICLSVYFSRWWSNISRTPNIPRCLRHRWVNIFWARSCGWLSLLTVMLLIPSLPLSFPARCCCWLHTAGWMHLVSCIAVPSTPDSSVFSVLHQ